MSTKHTPYIAKIQYVHCSLVNLFQNILFRSCWINFRRCWWIKIITGFEKKNCIYHVPKHLEKSFSRWQFQGPKGYKLYSCTLTIPWQYNKMTVYRDSTTKWQFHFLCCSVILNLNTIVAKLQKKYYLLKFNLSTSRFTTVFSLYTVYSAVEKLIEKLFWMVCRVEFSSLLVYILNK